MSIIPGGHFRRRYEPPQHMQIWDPFSHSDDHIRTSLTSPHMAFSTHTSSVLQAQIELTETPAAHVYKAHLPGLNHNEIRVEVEDDRVLCISGEKKVAKEDRTGKWHRIEHRSGHFVQRLTLPENAKVDQLKAYMENGVLTVTVPKYEVVNHHGRGPRTINISGN